MTGVMDTYRNAWMDMARMVAIILVVLTHAIILLLDGSCQKYR